MYKELRALYDQYMAEVFNYSELQKLQQQVYTKYNLSPAQGQAAWGEMLGGKTDTGQGPIPGQGGTVGSGLPPAGPTQQETELKTDAFTAYLQKLGVGGKTAYNPAEQYQVGLFDPLKSLYDINQRLYEPLAPTAQQGKRYGTFADFLGGVPEGGVGVSAQAGRQLRDIFNFSPEQKMTSGYEPGRELFDSKGENTGTFDQGKLEELQNLFRYGLRPTAGILGAKYAAGRLPQLQQAYYGQKTAQEAAGTQGQSSNFLDWLKRNYPTLSF